MERVIDRFPSIRKAYLEMVYDNGGVYNGMGHIPSRTEDDALDATEPVMGAEGVDEADLQRLDVWISTLTDEQIQLLVAGEQDEREAMEAEMGSPRGGPDNTLLSGLFNDLFDIC
jgi:hypothetical protein